MTEVRYRSIEDAAKALRTDRTSAVELVTAALARADRLDPELGAYASRFDQSALDAAAVADKELAAGVDRGPLHGIPIAVKDVIAAKDGPTLAGSLAQDPAWGLRQGDAPAVERIRSAGAIVIGKSTTSELACGMPDPEKPFPVPRNPWNPQRWAGGSSAGAGSGVAAGMFLGSLGTDTGGSIRIPAAFCGVSGLRPSFGLVPKTGALPLGPDLDVIGPLARSAWDCAAILNAIAGPHPADPASVKRRPPDYLTALERPIEGLEIGVGRVGALTGPDGDPLLASRFEAALSELEAAGAKLREIEIPLFEELDDVVSLTWRTQAGAYHRDKLQSRWRDLGAATRLELALGLLTGGADMIRLNRVRRHGRRLILGLFERVDAIVTPTAASGAPALGAGMDAILAMTYTAVWSAAGAPALTVPIGLDADEMPLGLQIAAAPLADQTVLRIGRHYQRRTEFHRRLAPLAAA